MSHNVDLPSQRSASIVYLAFIIACILYFAYVNLSSRSFEAPLKDSCVRVDARKLFPTSTRSTSIRSTDERRIGSRHSFSFLVSNPTQIVRGNRVQRLDVLNQLLVGVRDLQCDASLLTCDKLEPPVDSRLRTLSWMTDDFHAYTSVALIRSNESTLTDYNLFDLIDLLYVYARIVFAGTIDNDEDKDDEDKVHLWIGKFYDQNDVPLTNTERDRVLDKLIEYAIRVGRGTMRKRVIVERKVEPDVKDVVWLTNVESRIVFDQ